MTSAPRSFGPKAASMTLVGQVESLRGREILNLGCGAKKLAGAVNVDSRASVSPDIVFDLNVRPGLCLTGLFARFTRTT